MRWLRSRSPKANDDDVSISGFPSSLDLRATSLLHRRIWQPGASPQSGRSPIIRMITFRILARKVVRPVPSACIPGKVSSVVRVHVQVLVRVVRGLATSLGLYQKQSRWRS